MMYSVDRIEEDFAILIDEDGNKIQIKNKNFSEGDILEKIGENFVKNISITDEKRKEIFALQESLFDE